MAKTFISSVICYGLGYKRPLPAGWKLVESEEDWARAYDPQGREHMLGPQHAIPVIADGVLDMDRKIYLPSSKELEKLSKRAAQSAADKAAYRSRKAS